MNNDMKKTEKLPIATYAAIISTLLWSALAIYSPFIKTIGTFVGIFAVIMMISGALGVVELISEHKKGYKKDVLKKWGMYFMFGGFIITGVLLMIKSNNIVDNTVSFKKPFSWKRWYKFNKKNIPLYLSIISVLLITGLVDFKVQEIKFELKSHFDAINNLYSNDFKSMATFMVFGLNLLSMVQVFNTVTFSKTRSPFSTILTTLLTLLEVVAFGFYLYVFVVEPSVSLNYEYTASVFTSLAIFGSGLIFIILATVFSWIYVDWKYVKIEE